MAITAQELIDRARQRADFQGNPYLNDTSELLPWCAESYKELWDLIVEAYGEDYVVATTTVDIPPSATWKKIDALSPLLYKPLRLHRLVNGIGVPLRRFNLQDHILDQNTLAWGDRQDIRYHFAGTQILVQPIPNVTEPLILMYVPQASLAALTSAIDWTAEPWAEYIVIDLAIKMRRKEQSDTADLALDKQMMRQRIIAIAEPRDMASPQRAIDVRTEEDRVPGGRWWRDWF